MYIEKHPRFKFAVVAGQLYGGQCHLGAATKSAVPDAYPASGGAVENVKVAQQAIVMTAEFNTLGDTDVIPSRPASSHPLFSSFAEKVEKAKLVERLHVPHFALGLVAFRATQQERRQTLTFRLINQSRVAAHRTAELYERAFFLHIFSRVTWLAAKGTESSRC